jgi:flagella basal body P-ring formation protein FlgA
MRDIVTHSDIAASPLIRPGDVVRATARVGTVEVAAQLVAAESGRKNDVIRVVNQDTRFSARARVIEKGEVEVLNVR